MQASCLTIQTLYPMGSGWLNLFFLYPSLFYNTSTSSKNSPTWTSWLAVVLHLFPSYAKWGLSDDSWVRTNLWVNQNINRIISLAFSYFHVVSCLCVHLCLCSVQPQVLGTPGIAMSEQFPFMVWFTSGSRHWLATYTVSVPPLLKHVL